MNPSEENRLTAIACLREITRAMPQGINFEALTAEPELSDLPAGDILMRLADKLHLCPENKQDIDLFDISLASGQLVLLCLNNGNWVGYLGIKKAEANDSPDQIVIFDPLSNNPNHVILLTRDQLEKNWQGKAVMLKAVNKPAFSADGRHTAIYALAAIARHHGISADSHSILHEYAIEEDEPRTELLRKIAREYGMKNKIVSLNWSQLTGIGEAFPFMGWKNDGKAAVICGLRHHADSFDVVIWDPTTPDTGKENFTFLDKAGFEETFSGQFILIKKEYSIRDENQPFGLTWFIPEFLRQKQLFIEITLAVLAISAIALITPLFFQIVVDKILVHHSATTLNVLGVGIIVVLLFNAVLEFLREYLLLFATNKIDIRTATRTFQHMINLPVSFFERMPAGVLLKHMQQTDKIRGFLSGNLFFTLLELISLVVFIPFMLIYSVKLTLIVIGFTLLMAMVVAFLIKPFQRRLEELYLAEGKRQSMLVEAVNGIRTVKSLALEPAQKRKWNDTAAYAITRYFRVGQISLTAKTFSQFLEKIMVVAIIWIGAIAVFDKEMTVGALIAFQMLSGRVSSPLVRLVSLIHEYQQTALSVKMLGNVMNTPSEDRGGGGVRQPLQGGITLDNITFQYLPDSPPALKEVSLDIVPGSTIGIVGRSGSGKTTLTKLLQGLYPLQNGIIKFDGIDLKEIDRAHLRSSIGIVLQENFFFHGSVRENIAMTRKDASMEEVVYAARLAGAEEFIQKLPKGFDSVLEENASNLSGGQRQRLAIARALLNNPRILIFDEATSALDPESEELIRRNLKRICRNRTVIIVSHRLSMITEADNIIVLDNGKLTDSGNHRTLVSRPGIYREFWQQQMGGLA